MRYLGSDLVFNHKGELKSTKELKQDLCKLHVECQEMGVTITDQNYRIAELEDYCRSLELQVAELKGIIE